MDGQWYLLRKGGQIDISQDGSEREGWETIPIMVGRQEQHQEMLDLVAAQSEALAEQTSAFADMSLTLIRVAEGIKQATPDPSLLGFMYNLVTVQHNTAKASGDEEVVTLCLGAMQWLDNFHV